MSCAQRVFWLCAEPCRDGQTSRAEHGEKPVMMIRLTRLEDGKPEPGNENRKKQLVYGSSCRDLSVILDNVAWEPANRQRGPRHPFSPHPSSMLFSFFLVCPLVLVC